MLLSVPNFTKGETWLPSAFPHRASAPAPDRLGGPLLNLLPCIIPVYRVLGGSQNRMQYYRCGLTSQFPTCTVVRISSCPGAGLYISPCWILRGFCWPVPPAWLGPPKAHDHVDWSPWCVPQSWLCCLLQTVHKGVKQDRLCYKPLQYSSCVSIQV